MALHGGTVVSTVASQLEDPGSLGSFCVESPCSPCAAWVLSGFSSFLPQSKNMLRLIDDSKLSVGVNVSVLGCLSV